MIDRIKWFILLGLLLTTMKADACPVCFAAEEDTRGAFLLTTAFLSCLPWLMVGTFVRWYRNKSREMDRE